MYFKLDQQVFSNNVLNFKAIKNSKQCHNMDL